MKNHKIKTSVVSPKEPNARAYKKKYFPYMNSEYTLFCFNKPNSILKTKGAFYSNKVSKMVILALKLATLQLF